MRLKFFHFAKSNRHRERDRPMDETTEAKKGKQTLDGGGEQTESGILFASREKLIICRRAVTAESGPTISIRNIARGDSSVKMLNRQRLSLFLSLPLPPSASHSSPIDSWKKENPLNYHSLTEYTDNKNANRSVFHRGKLPFHV